MPLTTDAHDKSFLECFLDLAMPFTIMYLLIFYTIFEACCGVSGHADSVRSNR